MDTQLLIDEAKKLTATPKGILAIDESIQTCTERFEKLGVPSTEENRRAYREMLITTSGIEHYISGMIIVDETLRQKTKEGVPFAEIFQKKGMLIGVKVDAGTKDLALHPGEKITEGLDNLRTRLLEYKKLGATFAKWRAVIVIDTTKGLPTDASLLVNADALGRYAALCQEAGLVPIVEPEVLMNGAHTIDECFTVTSKTLKTLFEELKKQDVSIPGLILKTGMVISGSDCPTQASVEEVAAKTIQCLEENVPKDIGGIVFLSGGQNEKTATDHLRAMHHRELPWPLTFSYGRAIQNPALHIWAKDPSHIKEAQDALLKTAGADSLAVLGK